MTKPPGQSSGGENRNEARASPTDTRSPPSTPGPAHGGADNARKKRRLNRPITSCATCRRHKTRCKTVPGRGACHRCLSLRLDCDLPETADTDDLPAVATAADTALQMRLARIEQGLDKLTGLVQGVVDYEIPQAPRRASPDATSQSSRLRRGSTPVAGDGRGQSLSGVTRPVILVRNLQTQFFGPKRDFSDEQLTVGSIVSAGIVNLSLAQSLIRIFVKHSGLWISATSVEELPPDMEQRHPLLFSTVCLMAARHVPRIGKHTVHDMYMRVRRLASSVVFKAPPLAYTDLQALTLLSLFTPTIQTAMPIDSWMMSGIALNHAMLAFGFTSPEAQPDPADGTQEQLKRLRILSALCLTNIQFSIGNGRPCMVQSRFVQYCSRIVDYPDAQTTDGKLYAEVLLYSVTESILWSSQSGRWQQHELLVFPELINFRTEWGHLFDLEECLTLKFGYWYCQLLLYRASLRGILPEQERELKGAALGMSQAILECLLDQEFSVVLDLPDHFFFMVIYAGLTLCKWAIGDPLIAAAQHRLLDLAPNDEHIAHRFGCVLAEIRKKAAAAGAEDLEVAVGVGAGDSSEMAQAVDFLPGNDEYTWDTFLGWSTVGDLGGLNIGLEDTTAYEMSDVAPGFSTK